MTETRVIRAIAYLRISDLREIDLRDFSDLETLSAAIEAFFALRLQQLEEFARHISTPQVRWDIVKVIYENDVVLRESRNGKTIKASAHKKRKIRNPDGSVDERVWRPGFQDMLTLLREEWADGILCENLNRVCRDQYDGLDLRNVALKHKVNARSIAGTLTLTDGGTRGERTMLGIMVEIAADFSENLAWSVAQGRARKARNGEWGGGIRPFGFMPDGVTKIDIECEAIAAWNTRVLQDAALQLSMYEKREHSLARIAADMNASGIATVTGVPWTPEIVRSILLRVRNAGIMVYKNVEIGEAPWEPIVKEEIFRAVEEYLTNKDRATNQGGRPPVHQGSGVYLCGKCNDGTSVDVTMTKYYPYQRKDGTSKPVDPNKPRTANYRCRDHNHLKRKVAEVDLVVEDWIVDRFSQPDALDMFVVPESKPAIDTQALKTEKQALTIELQAIAVDQVKLKTNPDLLQRHVREVELTAQRDYAVMRLAEIEKALRGSVAVPSPLLALAKAVDVRATWQGYELATRQAILRRLVTVKIMPADSGTDSVVITPIDWEEMRSAA